jgi:uncharacterized repeat protein (TIGR01451 family)
VLDCDIGDMPDDGEGSTYQVVITAETSGETCGNQVNTAFVGATNELPEAIADGTNESTDTIVVNCPDVTVEKSGSGTIDAGQTASFTLIVTNLGPGTAADVLLSDTLPGTGWVENPDTLCTIATAANDVLTCDIGDMPASGEGSSFSVTLQRATTVADCGTLPNTGSVTASNEDAELLANNTDDHSITVVCGGSITIIKDVPGTNSQNFSFSDNIPGCSIGTLDDDPGSSTPKSETCSEVAAGTYTVSENLPSGWLLNDIDCFGSGEWDIDVEDEEVTITIDAEESVTCTFENDEELPPHPVPPTPVPPTLVAEIQPIQEVLVTPPQTGDGGLADGGSSWLAIVLIAAAGLAGSMLLGLRLARQTR